MADNVTTQTATLASIPTSTVIATDELTINAVAAQVQRVKVVNGPDGTWNADAGTFGASTSLLSTGLNSLASSSTAGYASAEVDVSSATPTDIIVVGQFQMTTAGSPTGFIDCFCLWSNDGTIYTGDTSYSGAAAAYTLGAAGSPNLDWLFSVKAHANTASYQGGASVRARLGFVPAFFAIVVLNNSGIALHTSGSTVTYRLRY